MRAGLFVVAAGLLTGSVATTAPDLAVVTPAELAAQAEPLGGAPVTDTSHVGGPALRLPSTPEGKALRLSGTLPWARARFLTMDAFVEGEHTGEVLVHFFAAGEPEARIRVSLGLFPGLRTRLALPLSVLDGQTLFLPRTPGRFKGRVRGRRLAPEEIDHVTLQLKETAAPQTLYLGAVALTAQEPRYRVPRKPLVDELGQWVAKEWEGKMAGDSFLGTYLTFALEKHRGASYPEGWCPRGGTTERTFKATGFFRTQHDGTRWWLVDPEGHGFFSLGLDAVRPGETAAVVPGTEALFGRLPPKRGPLGEAWRGPSGPWGNERPR
jgi:hypothetical protein